MREHRCCISDSPPLAGEGLGVGSGSPPFAGEGAEG